ncbi:hypothetical protein GWI34_24745 [Actinomadura sp. DSM 109109]|nr:hypothetical protein [Actinomadura lepetitiana]
MGIIYDYFIATSDEDAAQIIDWGAGPGHPPEGRPAKEHVEGGIDPAVQLGTLEAILAERPYEEVIDRPRHANLIAPDEESDTEQWVVTVSDDFVTLMADASDDQFAAAAGPWSETEEFRGAADPHDLEQIMRGLREIARRAREQRGHMYCWMSLFTGPGSAWQCAWA